MTDDDRIELAERISPDRPDLVALTEAAGRLLEQAADCLRVPEKNRVDALGFLFTAAINASGLTEGEIGFVLSTTIGSTAAETGDPAAFLAASFRNATEAAIEAIAANNTETPPKGEQH